MTPWPFFGPSKMVRGGRSRSNQVSVGFACAPFDNMKLSTLIEEAVAPHRDFGINIKVRLAVAATREPVAARNPAILYGVGNILENAVDFAHQTVEVNAWWNAETIEIVVSDDGPGIAPDMLKRIGEPFFQAGSTYQRRHEGTGLGLSIVKHILGLHHARLEIESEVGKGSVFSFHFDADHVRPRESAPLTSIEE